MFIAPAASARVRRSVPASPKGGRAWFAGGMLGVVLPSAFGPGLAVAFAAGALSFLSPCVLPLVPSYLSLMSGVSASDLAETSAPDKRRLVRSSLLFVAGYGAVFTALGAGASALGGLLQDHQVGLRRLAGVLIVAMGVTMAGLFRPRFFNREARFHVRPSALGAWAPPLMGAAFAFGWSPCIGPVLAGIYALASTTNSVARGAALLASYSIGLGVPFVVAGVAFGRLTGTFRWVKAHIGTINLLSGALLAAFGLLLLTNRVGGIANNMRDALDAIGLGGIANTL